MQFSLISAVFRLSCFQFHATHLTQDVLHETVSSAVNINLPQWMDIVDDNDDDVVDDDDYV